MSCSGIDEDYTPFGIPALPYVNKMETWNGREVRVLDKSQSFIGRAIESPSKTPAFNSSFFGTYLNNLHQTRIHSSHQSCIRRPNEPTFAILSVKNSPENVTSTSKLDAFIDYIRQCLQTIGRGMNESELLEFDSLLDPLNSSAVQYFAGIQIKRIFSHFLETLARGSETFSRGTLAPDVMNYQIPPPPEQSRLYKTEGINIEGMRITFINGMNNTYEAAMSNAEYIRSLTPNNMSINGIYSQTNGPILDGIETVFLNYAGSSPVIELLRSEWTEFHEKNLHRPNAKILHICHSRGSIDTCNALEGLPRIVQNRVIAISIASAKYISKEICYESYNYASEKDIIPLTDLILGSLYASALGEKEQTERLITIWENQRKLIYLKPCEDESIFDHKLKSKTFIQKIEEHLKDYVSHAGEYK
jgi:hypothetical protein